MPQREPTPPTHRAAQAPLRVFVGHEEAAADAVEPPPDGQPSRGHRMHFTLPAATTTIRLASPQRVHEEDTRQLGVAIQQIEIDGHCVPLDGPAIRSGFYRLEMGGSIAWRWTNGDALIEVPELSDQAQLTVAIAPWSLPQETPARRRRAAVVCWDVAHNPVGRAHVLYRALERDWDPELIGPAFRRFGSGLWPPLREEALTLRSFPADTLTDVWIEERCWRCRTATTWW